MNMNDLILDLHRVECIGESWAQNPTFMTVLAKDGVPALKKAERILHLVRLVYGDNIDELEKQLKQSTALCKGDAVYELLDDNSKIVRHQVTQVETGQVRYEAFSSTLHSYIQFTERDIDRTMFLSYEAARTVQMGRRKAKRKGREK